MLTKEQKKLILACGFKESRIPNYFYKKWEDRLQKLKNNYKDIRYELVINHISNKLILSISYTTKLISKCEDASCIFAEGDFDYIINIIKNL